MSPRSNLLRAAAETAVAAVRAARQRAGVDAAGFLGVAVPGLDPTALLADPRAIGVVASYERPDREFALVGVGTVATVDVTPGGGPESVRAAARKLLGTRAASGPLRPRLLGGFAFDPARSQTEPWTPFGAGSLVLPRLLFVRDRGVSGIVLAPGVDATEVAAVLDRAVAAADAGPTEDLPLRVTTDLSRTAMLASVATLSGDVRAGRYEKAVLAGCRALAASAPISIGAALARLRTGYPHCYVFSVTRDDTTFLGASPELLVALRDGVVSALGLAGSAPRGESEADDAALGEQLLHSAKDRIEHETVVQALREGLDSLTTNLLAPNQPGLLKLPNIQHLSTDVSAHARPGVDVLALVQRLHPTPAVCGWPTDAARRVITAHEPFDRGWYAGPIGWLDPAGDGEFAVALRSAVIRAERAWLFAGAGIMGDSEPESELAEIELKFRPLTGALGGLAG